eukprot:TRINITY_DN49589_c0_g1_i1.p1 TRINITY_DN49589_c0_g1~~TRINITY_DN49589_c0_g1_i1.p1  ORF type:complete len:555 (-),score=121.49 TRINITY_DN49589_c0_g1_i1:299-1909(-)
MAETPAAADAPITSAAVSGDGGEGALGGESAGEPADTGGLGAAFASMEALEDDEEEEEDASLTPRVLLVVERASQMGGGTEDEEPTILLPTGVLESWDIVRAILARLSPQDLQAFFVERDLQVPQGKERRIDKAVEFFQDVVRNERRRRQASKERHDAEELLAQQREAAAIHIQRVARGNAGRKYFAKCKRLAEEAAERARIAEEKAENWRTAQQTLNSAVVWLHGQGETEVGWQDVFDNFTAPESAGECRWMWPRAEISSCTSRGGAMTSQWFDTKEFPVCRLIRGVPDRKRVEEEPSQVTEAVMVVHAVIDALEAEGISTERIAVGGFGQGAALVAHSVLRYPKPLCCGVMLSAWIPCFEDLAAEATPVGLKTRLLWIHGARDAVVHPDVALFQAKQVQGLGSQLKLHLYPELVFGTSPVAVTAIEEFLARQLDAACGGDPLEDSEHSSDTDASEVEPQNEAGVEGVETVGDGGEASGAPKADGDGSVVEGSGSDAAVATGRPGSRNSSASRGTRPSSRQDLGGVASLPPPPWA